MELRSAIKVGITTLLGIGLFLVGWWFFAHLDLDHYPLYATFDDTIGLQKQTPLRMNGVTVGEVKSIELNPRTLKPVVTLSVNNKYRDKIPADSSIQITSGLLIANPQISIMPGTSDERLQPGDMWPQKYVVAQPLTALAQLSPEADKALKQLTATMQVISPKLTESMEQVRQILQRTNSMMGNFQAASVSAKDLLADPKIRSTMDSTLGDMKAMSHEARVTARVITAELRATATRNSGKVDEIANSAVDILQNLADTVDAARTAVTRLSEQVSDPRIQQSLVDTLELARTTIARFNQIASDIHQFSGDPQMQSDIKASVATIRETTADSQRLVEKVNNLVSSIKVPGGKNVFGMGTPKVNVDFLGRGDAPHFRSDVGITMPFGGKNFVNLGLYDFAENNRLTAQFGTKLDTLGSLRYGIYAAKLGVGLDWPSDGPNQLSMDLFDPNHLEYNLRARFQIDNDFSLWLGTDSLFRRTTPVIGVRLQR